MPRRLAVIGLPILAALTLSACVSGQSAPPDDPEARWYAAAADNYAANSGDPAAIERVIRRTFTAEPDRAVRIARCESGLNPWARNPSGASGIFQLMMPTHQALVDRWGGDVFNAVTNIAAAHDLYQGSGFAPWVCR